ncbi:MAG: hypothetical protein KDD53_03770, partial [Bdellovibrionales bacterium]|nr:hypothetical protein [Bdellovibrionales bacterium]
VFGLWFFCAFGLTINLFTVIGTIQAERLAYLPGIGFFAFVILVGDFISRNKPYRFLRHPIFISFLLILLFIRSSARIPVWSNNKALFKQTIYDAPKSPKALYNYGAFLYESEKDLSQSEAYLRKSFEMNPSSVIAAKAIAEIAIQRKDLARVEFWYRKILEVDPRQERIREQLDKLLTLKKDGRHQRRILQSPK